MKLLEQSDRITTLKRGDTIFYDEIRYEFSIRREKQPLFFETTAGRQERISFANITSFNDFFAIVTFIAATHNLGIGKTAMTGNELSAEMI